MATVLVPVRYPLSEHSKRTLSRAIDIAEQREGDLVILHINVYQNGERVTRSELKRAVEREFGSSPDARYVIREGFLVEETILEEVARESPAVVVIGHKQVGRWQRALKRLLNDPDIAEFLRTRIDAELEVVPPP